MLMADDSEGTRRVADPFCERNSIHEVSTGGTGSTEKLTTLRLGASPDRAGCSDPDPNLRVYVAPLSSVAVRSSNLGHCSGRERRSTRLDGTLA